MTAKVVVRKLLQPLSRFTFTFLWAQGTKVLVKPFMSFPLTPVRPLEKVKLFVWFMYTLKKLTQINNGMT